MRTVLSFLLSFLSAFIAHATEMSCEQQVAFISKASSPCVNAPKTNNLRDMANLSVAEKMRQCQATQEQFHCQDYKKTLDDDGQKKIITCDKMQLCENTSSVAGDVLAGCALGGIGFIKDAVESLWGLGQMARDTHDEEVLCSTGPNSTLYKSLMYDLYNSDDRLPKSLQMKTPPAQTLAKMTCAQIQSQMFTAKQELSRNLSNEIDLANKLKKPLSAEQKAFLSWQADLKKNRPDFDKLLMQKISAWLNEQGVKGACYNKQAYWELICKGALLIGTGAQGAIKILALAGVVGKAEQAAALAKAVSSTGAKAAAGAADAASSGKRVDDYVKAVESAERRNKGAGGQILNDADRENIFALRGALSEDESVAAFEKLRPGGKKLSDGEASQIRKMHEVGGDEGGSLGSYTPAQYTEKMRLARQINPETGKPYFTLEESKILMRNGITGVSKADQEKSYAMYSKLARDQGGSTYQRLHAEAANALGKTEEAASAYDRSFKSYVRELKEKKGVDLTDARSAEQTLKGLSEREFNQLEDLAAVSGNTERLGDISRAKWKLIENDIRRQNTGKSPSESLKIGDKIQDVYQELQAQTYSKNPLRKKMAEEEIKAMKLVYPNLR
jgi:hypothetical protein